MESKAALVLQNGLVFPGISFGAQRESIGEVVFTTGMTGYLETLTDPSYYGQIVVQTFPLIGNYGLIPSDFEYEKPIISAYIVKEQCQSPSNFRSEGGLGAFLMEQDIPGLLGVDTRALTKVLREAGTMAGAIVQDRDQVDLEALGRFAIREAVASVSPSLPRIDGAGRRVVLWDFGSKENIRRELIARGCQVITLPCTATAEEILSYKPEGIMLSNGPGDPAENTGIIGELAILTETKVPIFGICLGHQLLALAMGASTRKLKYGHRGANHPVRELSTGRVTITSQNHGYAVEADTLAPNIGAMSYQNANDGTCEGIDYRTFPAFSVQFHPEACAGPRDAAYLFDRFISLMEVQ